MTATQTHKASRYTVLLLFAVIAICRISRPDPNILSWDNFGYYLYLPNYFLYHDSGMKDIGRVQEIRKKYESSTTLYQVYQVQNGNWIIRYSVGNAVFYSPFFFIGHGIAKITGYPADGFSKPYQWAIMYGSLIYAFIALIFARKILLRFVDDKVASWTLIALFLGTNLFHMLAWNNGLTHGNLFMTYLLIIWCTIKWHERPGMLSALGIGFFCGLAIITRPTEIVSLSIPILWNLGSREAARQKWKYVKKYWYDFFLIAAAMLLVGFPQMLYWKRYAGHWIFRSYDNPGEGLDIGSPHVWPFLFSYRKGWLLYTPMMLLAVSGLVALWKKKREWFWGVFVFFVASLWLTASWTIWWYAGSFGNRGIVQAYGVLIVPLGATVCVAVHGNSRLLRRVTTGLLAVFLLFNIFQTLQYVRGVIHPERMSEAYYWKVFGKLDYHGQYSHLLLPERIVDASIPDMGKFRRIMVYTYDFETPEDVKPEKTSQLDTLAYSGTHSFRLDTVSPFLDLATFRYRDISRKDYLFVRVDAWIYTTTPMSENPLAVVRCFSHDGKLYGYSALNVKEETHGIRQGEWVHITQDYMTPDLRTTKDEFISYFWLQGKEPVRIDKIEVGVYEPE